MSNTFITMDRIAREAMPILENNLVMAGLVHRDFSNDFAKEGDTIQVKKPPVFTAVEFDGDLSGEYQDITETEVDVKLDKIADVSMDITSKELTLNIDKFNDIITAPAMSALAQKIDADLCGLYSDIPYYYGTSGATPNELSDISGARKILNNNKVPMQMRNLVIDPEADSTFNVLDVFAKVDASGSTEGLREASLGRKLGMNLFMDQNIKTHTAGGYSALADVTITAGASGATTITLTSAAGASTAKLEKGDIFKIDDYQFTVTTQTAAAASGVVSVSIYPALPKAYDAFTSAAVTFADVTARAHTSNLAFHKNAFALVSRPLMQPMGGANSYTTSIKNGINVRVTMGYDMDTKTNKISFDVLYGAYTLYKELAVRLLG